MIDAAIAIYNRTIGFFSLPFHFFLLPFHFFLLPFYFLLLISCEKQTTPVTLPNPQVTLTAEAGVIEAWLTVTTQEAEGAEVLLTRDGAERLRFAAVAETTVVDTGLLPAHSYTYAAQLLKKDQTATRSASVEITTMDTTSHNFTWEIYEFGGQRGSSVLYDVAIVNENDIWAVGEIHTAETDTFDSLGNWVPPYNAVHWDGGEWELVRFMVPGPGYSEIYSVFALGPNNVWMGQGSARHWDGHQWTIYNSNNGFPGTFRIRKIWGTSSENLYFVGDNGNIVHYDGRYWLLLLSEIELDFRDVWGAWNPQQQYWDVIAVASRLYVNYNRLIFQLKPSYTLLSDSGINWPLLAVWFSSGRKYYVAGSGIYEKHQLSERQWQNGPLDITHYTIFGMRGNAINDIVAAGGVGEIIHFNGMTWKSFFDVTQLGYGNYYAVDMEGDIIAAVGQDAPRGVIAMGRRFSPEN